MPGSFPLPPQKACEKALAQIEDNHYEEELEDEGIEDILKYGIAFYKKRCKVIKSDTK